MKRSSDGNEPFGIDASVRKVKKSAVASNPLSTMVTGVPQRQTQLKTPTVNTHTELMQQCRTNLLHCSSGSISMGLVSQEGQLQDFLQMLSQPSQIRSHTLLQNALPSQSIMNLEGGTNIQSPSIAEAIQFSRNQMNASQQMMSSRSALQLLLVQRQMKQEASTNAAQNHLMMQQHQQQQDSRIVALAASSTTSDLQKRHRQQQEIDRLKQEILMMQQQDGTGTLSAMSNPFKSSNLSYRELAALQQQNVSSFSRLDQARFQQRFMIDQFMTKSIQQQQQDQGRFEYTASALNSALQVPTPRPASSVSGLVLKNNSMRNIGSIPLSLPTSLALPNASNDRYRLSDHQYLLREQIEVFEASEDDVTTHTRGRNKPVTLGQVGIRCKHCAHIPVSRRQKGSTYFPSNKLGIYQAAQNMSTAHIQCGLCRFMPDTVKSHFVYIMENRQTSVACNGNGAGRPYWAKSASQLGLIDTEEHGIRFIRNLPPDAVVVNDEFR